MEQVQKEKDLKLEEEKETVKPFYLFGLTTRIISVKREICGFPQIPELRSGNFV